MFDELAGEKKVYMKRKIHYCIIYLLMSIYLSIYSFIYVSAPIYQ